jgi:hypothetical protein
VLAAVRFAVGVPQRQRRRRPPVVVARVCIGIPVSAVRYHTDRVQRCAAKSDSLGPASFSECASVYTATAAPVRVAFTTVTMNATFPTVVFVVLLFLSVVSVEDIAESIVAVVAVVATPELVFVVDDDDRDSGALKAARLFIISSPYFVISEPLICHKRFAYKRFACKRFAYKRFAYKRTAYFNESRKRFAYVGWLAAVF